MVRGLAIYSNCITTGTPVSHTPAPPLAFVLRSELLAVVGLGDIYRAVVEIQLVAAFSDDPGHPPRATDKACDCWDATDSSLELGQSWKRQR